MKRYGSLIINGLLLVFGVIGLYFTLFDSKGFMNADSFLYYTVQSNIFAMLIAALAIVFEIRRLKGSEIPTWVWLLRLISTVAITLTFVVFSLLLTPELIAMGSGAYLLSPGNLCVHNLVPICAILDWCIFGSVNGIKKPLIYLSLLPAAAYCTFALVRCALGLTIGGNPVPYFFLDYGRFGWLTIGKAGIGVVWWIIILAVALAVMSWGFAAIAAKRQKAKHCQQGQQC